jgi:hypothetical protein
MLGPAPPSACVHYFEPFELGTAPITVHKDSSQQHASFGKAAFTGWIHWWAGNPIIKERGVWQCPPRLHVTDEHGL